jgi:hypothetical protein
MKFKMCSLNILVGILCFICAACQLSSKPNSQKKPITYENLCGLSQEQMGKMDIIEVQRWVKDKYGSFTPYKDPRVNPAEQQAITAYTLGEANSEYGAAFLRNGYLMRVSMENIKNGVTFGQVVDRLGSPEYFHFDSQWYEKVLYDIYLDYPNLGITVGTTQLQDPRQLLHGNKYEFLINKNFHIDQIDCYVPNELELVLQETYFYPSNRISTVMQAFLSWPGFGTYISFGQ